jgi:arylsulfatase A-like enzyme
MEVRFGGTRMSNNSSSSASQPLLLTREQQKERLLQEKKEQASQFYQLALRGLTPFVMVAVFTVFLIAFGGKDKSADEYDTGTQKVLEQIDPMFSPIGTKVNLFHNPKFPDLMTESGTVTSPNIIFILADDLGYNSMSPEVSPFLSSMKDNGVYLSNYYAQEVCTPSRMSFLTGRYPLTLGWQYGAQEASETGGLPLDETTIAEVLQMQGYTTFMMGKWNAGNASPRYLPTARGFDYYFGYLDGYNNYWSKLRPQSPNFRDFMYSDSQCYYQYDPEDVEHYSTNLYGDAAVQAIEGHDFATKPLFMYLAYQAVHDPFSDNDGTFSTGVDANYMDANTYQYISDNFGATVHQFEYMKALAVMDDSVSKIHTALDSKGVLENSYIIFTSDNGGCPNGGGRNTPLRGVKGSLFEGGVKVDAFVYSDAFATSLRGSTYTGLFHVSDWFPTIVGLAGKQYSPVAGYELDGFDQSDALLSATSNGASGAGAGAVEGGTGTGTGTGTPQGVQTVSFATTPREYLVYNFYYNPEDEESPSESFYGSVPGAIRNSKYKLMHTYDSGLAGSWYTPTMVFQNDDDLTMFGTCTQSQAWTGDYTYYLFDLENDPYETTNLYDSSLEMQLVQAQLYAQLELAANKAAPWASMQSKEDEGSYVVWQENNNYVTPWAAPEDVSVLGSAAAYRSASYPTNCGLYSEAAYSFHKR